MKSLEEATRIKEQIEDELLKKPGVTGIDVGLSSARENQPVIRVYVADKQEAAQRSVFPSEIDGVPIILIERRFQLH